MCHSDKELLPYLEAVVWEAVRYRTSVPVMFHQTGDKDVRLGEYTIPKHSMVINNMVAVHLYRHTWGEDAFEFRPERFIDANGRFVKHSHLIPFSIGKRICPGELLAKQELYLFTGNLIKRFRFQPPDGVGWIDEEPIKDSVWFPKPFKLKLAE